MCSFKRLSQVAFKSQKQYADCMTQFVCIWRQICICMYRYFLGKLRRNFKMVIRGKQDVNYFPLYLLAFYNIWKKIK